MKAIGFTGTRRGMTPSQKFHLTSLLKYASGALNYREFHHGAAIGADTEAETIARDLGYTIHQYPAGDDPLQRNHVIVAHADVMIAAPAQDAEIRRSGTVRYARKAGKPVIVLETER